MKSYLCSILALLAVIAFSPTKATAQDVFLGDPTDGSSVPYTIMPGLPLLLPGPDEEFGNEDDIVNTGLTGDVDLVVRATTVAGASVPAPSGAIGGPAVATIVAGGGSAGQGAEQPFTLLISDGSGDPPYGQVLSSSDLDARPAVVFAFADLDGDGILGPTNADGSGDNALEAQEASAYSARQVGSMISGRVNGSLGFQVGAPSSIGGLRTALVAGVYAGQDPAELYAEGPLLLTAWPFFPPLDPARVIGNGNVPPPDPEVPSELKFELERNWMPAPSDPVLGTPFALPLDGSSPTIDVVDVISGPAVSAGLFEALDPANTTVRTRLLWRVAPIGGGSGRESVYPIHQLILDGGGRSLRLLPIDKLGNVADPIASYNLILRINGDATIVSPDNDADATTETITLADAAGEDIMIACASSSCGTLSVIVDGVLHERLTLAGSGATDSDSDGIFDDGDGSGLVGDAPCAGETVGCDDNCPSISNPSQIDDDVNGIGDCCDGICAEDPTELGCSECPDAAVNPPGGALSKATVIAKTAGNGTQRLKVKLAFELEAGTSLALDSESVLLTIGWPGGETYSVELPGVFEDRSNSKARFIYKDAEGTIGGVSKGIIAERRAPSFKALLSAKGLGLTTSSLGTATITLHMGDDTVAGFITCTGTASRTRCKFP